MPSGTSNLETAGRPISPNRSQDLTKSAHMVNHTQLTMLNTHEGMVAEPAMVARTSETLLALSLFELPTRLMSGAPFTYPSAKTVDVVDDFHGQ